MDTNTMHHEHNHYEENATHQGENVEQSGQNLTQEHDGLQHYHNEHKGHEHQANTSIEAVQNLPAHQNVEASSVSGANAVQEQTPTSHHHTCSRNEGFQNSQQSPGQHQQQHSFPEGHQQGQNPSSPMYNQQNMMNCNNTMPGYHHCHCYGHCRGQIPNPMYQGENTFDIGNLTLSGAKLHLPINNNQFPAQPTAVYNMPMNHMHPAITSQQIQHHNHQNMNNVDMNKVNQELKQQTPVQLETAVVNENQMAATPKKSVQIESQQESIRPVANDQNNEASYPEFRTNSKRQISNPFTADGAKNLIYFQTDDFYNGAPKPLKLRDNVTENLEGSQSLSNLNPGSGFDKKTIPVKSARSMVNQYSERPMESTQKVVEVVPSVKEPVETRTIGDCQSSEAINKQLERVETKIKQLSKSVRLTAEQNLSKRRNGLE